MKAPGSVQRPSCGGVGTVSLTGPVVLALAADGQRVDVEPQVPGHGGQQQHGEGAVRVVVVYQRVDLARLQAIARHVALAVEQRPQHLAWGGGERGSSEGCSVF